MTRSCPALLLAILPMLSISSMAAPPDLINGGLPGDSISTNLGPTGMRGWVYHDRADSSESRQILIHRVDSGSPASGIISANDVILGADGTGADPVPFSSDARKSFGLAIADAEARDPAELKLLRWRANVTSIVTVTLEYMGAYSATAPYNCPKSAKILEDNLYEVNNENGRYSFSILGKLALYNPDAPVIEGNPDSNYLLLLRAEYLARKLIPSEYAMSAMMSDNQDTTSMVTWERGHNLLSLTEYYLATGDAEVLPAIEAHAVNIAKNHSLFGTTGHKFADKNLDGSANGPMGGVYGTVNSAGLPCFLGLLLARECGLNHPGFQADTEALVEAAIERSSRFFAYYAQKGAIPYGEHSPGMTSHESNGKSGLAALAFALQDNRTEESDFYARMAAASASERENGHTGAYFNYVWAPLGAAVAGEEAVASYFARTSWYYDLAREWDGGFAYDCLNTEGPNSGSSWNDFPSSTAMILTYALPLRSLHITGRGHDSSRWLNTAEVAETAFADTYDATSRSTNELVTDLGSWSPKVRIYAARELGTRTTETTALLPTLHALANDPNGNSRVGACQALGEIGHADSAPVLAALLTDPDYHVRWLAAESLRYLPPSAGLSVLDTILEAAANTAEPIYPLVEEDPMQYAHGTLAMLLFWSGGGQKGLIWNDLTGVDRDLLYPAIQALAQTPNGRARSSLRKTFENLSAEDLNALAGTVVDAVYYRAPADKMFSSGVRQGGLVALQAHNIAEGVPLCRIYPEEDTRNSVIPDMLDVLEAYAGGVNTVEPDPQIISYLQGIVDNIAYRQNPHDERAQEVMDIIAADTNPVQLTPFKSIQSITADTPALTLPANQTTLRVAATDLAGGDSVYTWRKVYGAGDITFSPNGTGASKDTTITFDNVSDRYLIEVTMSDSRGLTEVSETILVSLADTDGSLPPDTVPPTPSTMTWSSPPQALSDTSVMMTATTASDPSGVEYYFTNVTITDGSHDSGWQDSPSYTDTGLTGNTTYTYTVQARDKSDGLNPTIASAGASVTTPIPDTDAPTPNPMTFAAQPRMLNSTSITMTATTATDANTVEYYFTNTSITDGSHDSGWQESTIYVDTGLSPETAYTYTVTARDKTVDQNTTNPSSPATAETDWLPPTSGSLLTAGVDISFGDNAIRTLSVYPGKAEIKAFAYDGVTSVTIPFGTVVDYKLFKESATTADTIASYADGGGTEDPLDSRVSEVTSTDTSINNLPCITNIWADNDPDLVSADISSPVSVNGHNGTITGTVNVSGLSSGTVYFIYGSYAQRACNLSATMSDAEGLADDLSELNFGGALQIAGDTEYLVTPLRFANNDGYDTITYELTHSSSGKFIGVVVSDLSPISGNTPPTISAIADQSVISGGSTDTIDFTIGDAETAAGSLTVTASSSDPDLVPDGNIMISGSDADRTVTVTPASGLTGAAIITVTVDDGTDSSNETFLVTVTGNYLMWATEAGMSSDPNADSNSNGIPNLVEYSLADGAGHGELTGNTITFTKRGAPFGGDLTYVIELSSDLGATDPWTPAASGVAEDASSISYTFPPSSPTRKFARLKVVAAP